MSRAVNEGIKLAKGEYILLLNNDTELCKGFLEEMLHVIEKDHKIFDVSSKMIQYHNQNLIDDAGDEYTVIRWPYKRGDGRPISEFEKEERIFSTCVGIILYRKEVFGKIGYYDESFLAYMKDVDNSYRANIYSYKNIFVLRVKVYHIGSAMYDGRYSEFKLKLSACNSIYVPYKNMPFLQLIINLPYLLLGIIVKQRVFVGKSYDRVYKNELIKGMKLLKMLRRYLLR